jgi:hypothetical protein
LKSNSGIRGYERHLLHGVLLPLLLLPPPCCPDVASAALPPLPEGEVSREPAAALLPLPRLFVVAEVTLGHVFSPKPERAILNKLRNSIVTNLLLITPEHNRCLPKKSRHTRTDTKVTIQILHAVRYREITVVPVTVKT